MSAPTDLQRVEVVVPQHPPEVTPGLARVLMRVLRQAAEREADHAAQARGAA